VLSQTGMLDDISCDRRSGARRQLAARGRNESSSTVVTAENVSSLASTSYNDTATSVVHRDAAVWRRHLLAVATGNTTGSLSSLDDNISSVDSDDFINRSASTAGVGKSYPDDVFTDAQLYRGAVVLHAVGTVYMFLGLAIVCDEYFIPALEVITSRLGVTEDVAGATLMAAGGSAPELFTSVIGVFVAHSDVGIGTIVGSAVFNIVGSAVFNIVFVIGACSLASERVLALTWWPLCRDVLFYCASLLCLIGCFVDRLIHWWEDVDSLRN